MSNGFVGLDGLILLLDYFMSETKIGNVDLSNLLLQF